MSALMRAAKVMRVNRAHPGIYARYHRGDPGFLGSLWSGIKGAAVGFVTGGPAGALLGGVTALAGGARSGGTVLTSTMAQARPLAADPRPNILSPQVNIGNVAPGGAPLPPMMYDPRGNTTQGGTSGTDWNASSRDAGGTPCARGYHYNKSDYFTKKYGFVPRGTVCVKNRRRNPLNPRALSRAMGRITSAKSAAKVLNKISIRSNCGCK